METLNKHRNLIVMGTVILFLLLFAFYMLSLRPLTLQIEEQSMEMKQLGDQNQMIKAKVDELKAEDAAKDAMDSSKLHELLPDMDNSEQLLLDLSYIGNETYVELTDASFTLSDSNRVHLMSGSINPIFPDVKEVTIAAVLKGTYDEIRQWMTELQNLPRLVSVDSFSFQQPYEERDPGSILTANVSYTAYYIPVP
ncbi:type IV pilus assembly protein PilO [Paenibacillus sp. DS2015]|uniref:type 4a pilus biogenesis protein PilO n=1 Tax=Paenibacillus sp. DS2015 TaxID=3373917 RepID=UPI003D1E35A0